MNVFIGCSSKNELDVIYYDEAKRVSSFLASLGYDLLIGGINGVMNTVIKEFSNKKRNISIMETDCYKDDASKYLYPVYDHKTIYLRKADLIDKADLIIFMPGGIGTLDELFTVLESRRALEHDKKIIILNINGYYNNLFRMLDDMYSGKFASIDNKNIYTILNSFEEFKDCINDIDKGGLDD